jgi:prepilin-type processing-associated H-X9-DG protein
METSGDNSLNLGLIKLPSQYLLSGDVNYFFGASDADPDDYSQDTLFSYPSAVHNGQVNVLFADQHVQACQKFDPATMTYHYDLPGIPFNYTGQW